MIWICYLLILLGISMIVYAFRSKIFGEGKMKEETKVKIITWSVLIGLVLFFASFIISLWLAYDIVEIEDEVIDVDISNDNYMVITFSNGESYNVAYSTDNSELDFTVNSRMKIKLRYMDSWCFPNGDNVWNIIQIVKIPNGGESP